MWLARVRVVKYGVHRGLHARARKAESSALPDIQPIRLVWGVVHLRTGALPARRQ